MYKKGKKKCSATGKFLIAEEKCKDCWLREKLWFLLVIKNSRMDYGHEWRVQCLSSNIYNWGKKHELIDKSVLSPEVNSQVQHDRGRKLTLIHCYLPMDAMT